MPDQVPAVGIDLGTTFSCIALYRNGRAEIIPDKSGDRLIPSFVYFHPTTGDVSVGKIAYELSAKCPGNLIRDAKRLIGRKFEDEYISKYTKSHQTLFNLVRGPEDMAAIQVEINGKKEIKTPEDVSAEILKYLKNMAQNYVAQNIEEVVISVPAYFSNAQRKATKRAAEMAGLKVLKLITEPVAGAIHYVADQDLKSRLLVFDWGGGTLDVSLISVNKKTFKVKAVYGDTFLGGRDLDEILFNHFYVPVKRTPTLFIRRLLNKCITLKEQLSVTDCIETILDYYDGDQDLTLAITRTSLENLTHEIFERALDIVKIGLSDSGWDQSTIDAVVLVGGSSRTPKIMQMLETFFGRNIIKTDLNPDEAVSAGACIQAALLKKECRHLEDYKITEVTPLSLGLSGEGDLFKVFIKKNSQLPAFGSHGSVTAHNNQETVVFDIYEGERKNCAYNSKLGEIVINDLPPGRAGEISFNVNFNLDEDGILKVTAFEKSSGQEKTLVVTMGEFRLSERRVKLTKELADKMRYEDDVFKKFVSTKTKLHKQCKHILYDLDKVCAKEDKEFVKGKCEDFIMFSNGLEFTDIEKLEGEFIVFRESVANILSQSNMWELQDSCPVCGGNTLHVCLAKLEVTEKLEITEKME